MAKPHKQPHRGPSSPSPADLKARIERTRAEGRWQIALDLVKQLHKLQPTSETRELLKDTYFQRAVQLRSQGMARDAATVLEVASRLDEKNVPWLAKLVEELGRCGDSQRSAALLEQIKNLGGTGVSPKTEQVTLANLADASLVDEKSGRKGLPPELQQDHDCIVRAFQALEAGRDQEVRDILQGIGLRSPFADWKLLVRGFQAYYVKDDERALDNWQRLDEKRVPVRLAAPFRASIDADYRQRQARATQHALAEQLQHFRAGGIEVQIQAFRQAMGNSDTLAPAFRAAAALLPTLRKSAPHLVTRMASCMYWNMLRYGPSELARYRGTFGLPPDDLGFHRITALATEQAGDLETAHKNWALYEKEIASHPEKWPGEQGKLARALVWLQMGNNAATIPTGPRRKKLPKFLRDLGGLPEPLKPDAAECFQKSLELAPTLLEAHEGLFEHYSNEQRDADALRAGKRLLEVHPNHVATLLRLAVLHRMQSRNKEAIEALEQALRHNPLDRTIRSHLGTAHLTLAREYAEKRQFPEARVQYETGMNFHEPPHQSSVLVRWAATEIKAGDRPRADELLAKAREKAVGELLVTYQLLVETIRLELPGAFKTQLTREFNKQIAETPEPTVAVALAAYAAELESMGLEYHGKKTHFKKTVAYATKVPSKQYTEPQLTALLKALILLDVGSRQMKRLCEEARRQYPKSPWFPYLLAVYLMGDDPEEGQPPFEVQFHLQEAQNLAHERPADEPGIKELIEDVKRRRELIRVFNPFFQGLLGMMGKVRGGVDPSRLEDIFEMLGGMGGDGALWPGR